MSVGATIGLSEKIQPGSQKDQKIALLAMLYCRPLA